MITIRKKDFKLFALWISIVILLFIFVLFGKQLLQWVLMKLYEFFIQKNPKILITNI
jgi:hypothetical protein